MIIDTGAGLEQLALEMQNASDEYEKAKLISDQLKADEVNYLHSLMTELEAKAFSGQKVSDTKLERLVRGTEEFRAYVRGRIIAEGKTLHLKNKRDNLNKLWESKRSVMSFERETVAKGIYHKGR